MKKVNVGILGATGAVGQRFIQLLENHPVFEIKYLMASKRSAGKKYKDAVNWKMNSKIPKNIENMIVKDSNSFTDVSIVFSALDSSIAKEVEEKFANEGKIVISNSKNHRMQENVPLIIPEVNYEHIKLIESQKTKGKIITNPNCSSTVFTILCAVINEKWKIDKISVTTLQAISGAGYPGISSYDMIDNVIPYIEGEEEKMEIEPLKIMGELKSNKIENADILISAQANRVFVLDGHLENISIKFKDKIPTEKELIEYLDNYKSKLEKFNLNFAPTKLFNVILENDRPQPRIDRDFENGMGISVARIRKDNIFDFKMVVLGHNTIRGAAGGAILNAELYHCFYLEHI